MAPSPVVTGRFIALTMPEVTVAESPSGEPIATTGLPDAHLGRGRRAQTGRRPLVAESLRTAMS